MIRDPVGTGMHCALQCTTDGECGQRGHCSTVFGPQNGFCVWPPPPPPPPPTPPPDNSDDRAALEAIWHSSKEKPPWNVNVPWGMCTWQGIKCNAAQRVTYTRWGNCGPSTIPTELGKMEYLESISLYGVGGSIPDQLLQDFDHHNKLTELSFNSGEPCDHQLTGTIPP